MTQVLFPGRHLLLTNYQFEYLQRLTKTAPAELEDRHGNRLTGMTPIDTVIWIVTSANHSNTRRNPIPSNRREVAIERFGNGLEADSFVFHIDDVGTTPRFAEYVIKKVAVDSRGRFRPTPEDTVIACSTPEVIDLYEQMGYRVLPVELADLDEREFFEKTPWQILNDLTDAGVSGTPWKELDDYTQRTAEATRWLYEKYCFEELIVSLHRSPLLTEDGDLTETRDYNTYVRSFDAGAQRKFERVHQHLRAGRIVDIGCCTGALLREISHDDRFRESDLYGIEVARPLYAECLHRKEQNHFGNDNVFFYQQDFAAGTIFPDESIDTFLTFSLTHEIESYGGRAALLRFLELINRQTVSRGRWINVDVVGPDNKEELVWAQFARHDGRNDDYAASFDSGQREAFKEYLDGLSTFAKFLRFVEDFRSEEGELFEYELVDAKAGRVQLRMMELCEFLSKKDYTDNWASEMHERFCFWSFDDWKSAIQNAGFQVSPESNAYQNPWIVENRYQGKVEIMKPNTNERLPYPVTNMLLIAEKA